EAVGGRVGLHVRASVAHRVRQRGRVPCSPCPPRAPGDGSFAPAVMACPHVPHTLYELNTRLWIRDLGVRSLADVPDAVLDDIAARGFDLVWLMGVWQPSPWSEAIA